MDATGGERTPAAALLLKFTRLICRSLLRLEIEGQQRLANLNEPAVVVFNHLSIADGPIILSLLPRAGAFLIAREFDRIPVLGWCMRMVAHPIYIDRHAPDRAAVRRAKTIVAQGGLLCLAPEGRVSPTRALSEGHQGAAFLAKAASARIVPIASYGHEKFWRHWLRLRRPRVHVTIGEPFALPYERAAQNTPFLMQKLAELLPPQYQGVYRAPESLEGHEGTACGHASSPREASREEI